MSSIFKSHEGFCPDCGSVLPLLRGVGGVQCYTCKHEFGPNGNITYNFMHCFSPVLSIALFDVLFYCWSSHLNWSFSD